MKNNIRILIMAVVFTFLGYMVYSITLKYMQKEAIQNRISTIPSFRLERLGDGFFTENDLTENKCLVLLYFNSACEFCRLEAKAIKDRIEEFNGVQLVFISTEEKVDIMNFAEEYDLYANANVVFLQDPSLGFSRIFGISTVPATFVYNKNRQLIKQFKGPVKVDLMLEAFQQESGFN